MRRVSLFHMSWRRGLLDKVQTSGWLMQVQVLAVTVLGIAVLLPFAMAAGLLALAAGLVLLGPIGVSRLMRHAAGRRPGHPSAMASRHADP